MHAAKRTLAKVETEVQQSPREVSLRLAITSGGRDVRTFAEPRYTSILIVPRANHRRAAALSVYLAIFSTWAPRTRVTPCQFPSWVRRN